MDGYTNLIKITQIKITQITQRRYKLLNLLFVLFKRRTFKGIRGSTSWANLGRLLQVVLDLVTLELGLLVVSS